MADGMPIMGNMPRHTPFSMSRQHAENLFNSADGMQQNRNPDWAGFPQRTQNEWGVGFDQNYNFLAGEKRPDGVLSFEEKGMAQQQLTWDSIPDGGPAYNDTGVNSNPISPEGIAPAREFLGNLFNGEGQLRPGIDSDGDGQFTMKDLIALAGRDGDASNITSRDFDKALGVD